jgi:hypothetical protein
LIRNRKWFHWFSTEPTSRQNLFEGSAFYPTEEPPKRFCKTPFFFRVADLHHASDDDFYAADNYQQQQQQQIELSNESFDDLHQEWIVADDINEWFDVHDIYNVVHDH